MDAYRDQYAQLFGGGKNVTLLAISTDADTALASWARDRKYPFTFVSDRDGTIGKQYGVHANGMDNRTLFVVGPDGKIAYRAAPFREVDPMAYEELGAAIKRAR
ncbi:MAG: peroxiredoxin family protein [Gemmatimonadales bacterium]|jgi:peroxiredoxin|nr:peroxiredoxin family protein [Gemmatimonadales bacterium]